MTKKESPNSWMKKIESVDENRAALVVQTSDGRLTRFIIPTRPLIGDRKSLLAKICQKNPELNKA